MILRELLLQNHSETCYKSANMTRALKSGKRKYEIVGELWVIPVELLDKEVLKM